MYRHIIYANAVFDIDKIFSRQGCNLCAVSVVTLTQIVNVPFDAIGYIGLGTGLPPHETVADRVLDCIYTDYSEEMSGKRNGSNIYYETLGNNIFALLFASAKCITIVIDEKPKITQMQYDKISEYLESLRRSESVRCVATRNNFLGK